MDWNCTTCGAGYHTHDDWILSLIAKCRGEVRLPGAEKHCGEKA